MPHYADISNYTEAENSLWDMLKEHQSKTYFTSKGLDFTYTIKGNELFVSRKEKSITRSTVNQAFRKATELMQTEGCVSGPKKLGTFGASYLYPVFISVGICKK